ncbi:hypothetical protein XENOCAPTIV_012167 [Xenoophorus captivus]|uniref:Uncharacterized protein n=1 Tax=Xenoophorus captivus TaxID=1517983 RepID=A0ABV0R3Q1_9TELE
MDGSSLPYPLTTAMLTYSEAWCFVDCYILYGACICYGCQSPVRLQAGPWEPATSDHSLHFLFSENLTGSVRMGDSFTFALSNPAAHSPQRRNLDARNTHTPTHTNTNQQVITCPGR